MKYFLTSLAVLFSYIHFWGQHVQFKGNYSLTWSESIAAYRELDEQSDMAKLVTFGFTDSGKPLHLFIINKDEVFYPELFDRSKTIVLINNDIHAGEPDGVDASVMLCKELLDPAFGMQHLLDDAIICIVPMYNVDGALNRGKFHRANQDGPNEYGFRANALNLDLNRDFIKCDSKNALAFAGMFTKMKPHVFVDTHVSNGADYPYTMTLITTQPDKLGGPNAKYLKEKLEPTLFRMMKERGHEMCPYVNTMGRTPESGISQFLETPRFATGYTALFNTIGFTTETHMLKPFEKRVESTYQFLITLLDYAHTNRVEIIKNYEASVKYELEQDFFPLEFRLDTTRQEKIKFQGYEAKTKASEFGSGSRLYYDHQNSWLKEIPFYNKYVASKLVNVPSYYIIPQAWDEVIERLAANGIEMERISADTTLMLEVAVITNFDSPETPYEGHFVHSNVRTELKELKVLLFEGDYLINTKQQGRRFLLQTLEPNSEDGYFAWNFFDSVLQQKEWFSDYVFEDKATELLAKDPELKSAFEKALKTDESLKDNHWNQLYWIYKHSPYYEITVNRYPVYRFNGVWKK